MAGICDIHCHYLPYVDDGAENLEEALQLLRRTAAQGISTLCLTPHHRSELFETPDEEIVRQFQRLQVAVRQFPAPLSLFLGREYYADDWFLEKAAAYQLMPLGNGNTVLVEFSPGSSYAAIRKAVQLLRSLGYLPLVAHAERYACLWEPGAVAHLVRFGARIQINADSILGRNGREEKGIARLLLREQLVDAVASDGHGLQYRPSELAPCAKILKRLCGADYAQHILENNPRALLGSLRGKHAHESSHIKTI